jgi:hypothetical protein
MKAKSIFAWLIVMAVILVVAAFLAMHSINLFTFVFPPDQQQWAWMGFGLTGGGAVGYLVLFLWLAHSKLQKVISFAMMVICSIGEVLAAIFGMQIESWTKSGWELKQNEVQSMLMVIGILAILHFFALITHFAGDKIIEMFQDDDGDGTPNAFDKDYQPKKQPAQKQKSQNNNGQYPNWELDAFLKKLNLTQQQAEAIIHNNGAQNPDQFYSWLKAYGVEQINISRKNFNRLYGQLRSKVNP